MSDFLSQLLECENFQVLARQDGIPALNRLYNVAHNDTGQALRIRRFLLGLYNGQALPFNLNEFRGLDSSPEKEMHLYFENGKQVFRSWAEEQQAIQ
ncbi:MULTISPECIES: DUF7673 family protein [Methylomonas]|uniref:DUF7673 domain-containing protein n=1 Tax=Methylomonas koyamae TaxID=702114 RepID=A0A177P4E2_9GAMM|nr:hypothetical protein [Methylomonas koyamae]OAI25178.1 hypothetical protein A1355_19925 [Methylomonas koyamae]